jgi:RNA polymerase sigma factor (TIGR02999 family)
MIGKTLRFTDVSQVIPLDSSNVWVPPMNEVTRVLSAIEGGDPHAAEQLLPLVYGELRRLAVEKMAHEKPGQTLQATALVHEAYVRLVDVEEAQHWDSRGHFFAAAAEAMRRILIEEARRKQRVRHGGGRKRLDIDRLNPTDEEASGDLLAVDEALERLAAENATVAGVVKLRYFAGLTMEETAAALGISLRTANRHWAFARAWLYEQLSGQSEARD